MCRPNAISVSLLAWAPNYPHVVPEVYVAIDHPAQLGECPTWDERGGVLFWADIEGQQIHRFNPETNSNESRDTSGRPGSFVLTGDPEVLLVAMEHELVWFHWPSGNSKPFVSIEEAGNGNRLNDGKTDRAGRYLVGSMFENPNDGRATGTLYSVEGDGSFTSIRQNIGVSNGLGFDRVHERAYFADTHTRTIQSYDYDNSTGTFSNEQLFCDYGEMPGLPDGACVDSEGFYWSASVYGWSVIRINPAGEVVQRIAVPVEKPSMPAFGGVGLKTLYITTIGMGGAKPSADGIDGATPGAVFAVDAGIAGVAETLFAGTPPAFTD